MADEPNAPKPIQYQPNPANPDYQPNPGLGVVPPAVTPNPGGLSGMPDWLKQAMPYAPYLVYPPALTSPFLVKKALSGTGEAPPAAKPAEPAGPPTAPVYLDPNGGAGGMQLTMPTYVPAHEEALVAPQRQQAEQNAYEEKRTAIAGENAALQGEKEAQTQLATAQGGVSTANAEGWERLAERANKAASGVEERQGKADKESDDWQKKIDTFSASLANNEIDPNRLWHNASTPSKIAWSIATVLGGLAQGMMRTPTNQVADQIAARVRADVDAQKANYEVKRGRLRDMENLYGLARQHTSDANQAHALAEQYGMEAAKAQINQLVAAAGNPVAAATGAVINSQLDTKAAANTERSADVGIQQTQRGIAENTWVRAHTVGGGAGNVKTENVFRNVDGNYYAAKDAADKKILAGSAEALANLNIKLDAYEEALKNLTSKDIALANTPFHPIITPKMALARTAHIAATSVERKAQQDGVWKKSEQEMLDRNLQPPEVIFGDAKGQMGIIRGLATSTHNSTMKTYAPDPVVSAPQPVGARPKNIPTGQNYQGPAQNTGSFVAAGGKAAGGPIYARAEGGPVEGGDSFVPIADAGQAHLQMYPSGQSFYVSEAPPPTVVVAGAPPASLSAPAPRYSSAEPVINAAMRGGVEGAAKAGAKKPRKMTPEEMNAEADRMLVATQAQKEAALAEGPAVHVEQAPAPWLQQYMAQANEDGRMTPSEAQYMAQYIEPPVAPREDGGPVKGSNEAALRKAYLLGRAHSMEQFTTGQQVPFAYGGAPRKGEELVDDDPTAPRFRRVPAPGAAQGRLEPADQDTPMPENIRMVAPAAPPAMVAVSGQKPAPVVVARRGALSPPTAEEGRVLQGPSEAPIVVEKPAPVVVKSAPVVVAQPAPAKPGFFARVGNAAHNAVGKVGNAAATARDYVDSGLGRVEQGVSDAYADAVDFVENPASASTTPPPIPARYVPPAATQYPDELPTAEAKNAARAYGGSVRGADHPMAKVSAIRRFAEKSKKSA